MMAYYKYEVNQKTNAFKNQYNKLLNNTRW